MSDLDSGAFLDCLLNYASAASVALKSTTATRAVLKPAAVETVGCAVWRASLVFDDSEAAGRRKRGEGKRKRGSTKNQGSRWGSCTPMQHPLKTTSHQREGELT